MTLWMGDTFRRRMKLFGLNVELNPFVKNTCALLGIELGILLTLLIPATALALLFLWTHFQVGFALLIGFRARLSYIQIQSLKFEKQIREFKKSLDSAAVKSTPPSAPSVPKEDLAGQPPSNSKDDKC